LVAAPPTARALLGGGVATPGAVVFGYHDVAPYADVPDEYRVTPRRFRYHLDLMMSWGLVVVSLNEIVERLETGLPIDGLAAITFDDALVGVFDWAAPLLLERDLTATIFASTGSLGREHPGWSDARRCMTDLELKALAAAGFAIGSHGITHRPLTELSPDERATELLESRVRLESLAHVPVDLFAYPDGRHDAMSRDSVAEAGYRAGFGFTGGRVLPGDDLRVLSRVCMHHRQGRLRMAHDVARPASAWPGDPYFAAC